ncbi:MAG: hypothetical protein PHF60_00850 [Candidatus ainarchaeum sp.]|nr:hypothetical protein [Candidatus ainarchaeum sp.]
MKTTICAIMILVLLVLPLCYADVGPSPAPPNVAVHLIWNGAPASTVDEITYHCMGSDVSEPTSAVEPHTITLSCSGGTCTNSDGWYYKFNPCFDFPRGYFSYTLDGNIVRTEEVKFTDTFTSYDITIDAESGQVSSKLGSNMPTGCLPALLLPALLGVAFILSRK